MALIPFLDEIFKDPTFSTVFILSAFGIGIFQGQILGKAILLRFRKLQNHAKIASVCLFFLFLANAILSVPRFASPEKIDLDQIFSITNPNEFASLLFTIFGIGTGFLAVMTISITIMTLVLLKITHISGYAKIFVLFFSSLLLIFTGLSRFTDMTPSTFEVFLYFLYQFGITIGIVVGTARKIKQKQYFRWRSNI